MAGATDSTAESIWKDALTLDELTRLSRGTLVDHLGIHFVEIANNRLVAELRVTSTTAQPMEFLHGGASLALTETVGSLASQMAVGQTLA